MNEKVKNNLNRKVESEYKNHMALSSSQFKRRF